jgi:hypothetical protein
LVMAEKEIEIYTGIEQKDWGRADPARERELMILDF